VTGQVFISYSRSDRAYVDRLARFLSKAGLSSWYDFELVAGDAFPAKIQHQIDTCAASDLRKFGLLGCLTSIMV
jgi:hypothetical protein